MTGASNPLKNAQSKEREKVGCFHLGEERCKPTGVEPNPTNSMTAQSNGGCDNYPHNEMRKRGWLSLGRRNANGEANEIFGGGPEKGEGKEYIVDKYTRN